MEHGIIEIGKLDRDTYLEILKIEMINCHTLKRTAESLKRSPEISHSYSDKLKYIHGRYHNKLRRAAWWTLYETITINKKPNIAKHASYLVEKYKTNDKCRLI